MAREGKKRKEKDGEMNGKKRKGREGKRKWDLFKPSLKMDFLRPTYQLKAYYFLLQISKILKVPLKVNLVFFS